MVRPRHRGSRFLCLLRLGVDRIAHAYHSFPCFTLRYLLDQTRVLCEWSSAITRPFYIVLRVLSVLSCASFVYWCRLDRWRSAGAMKFGPLKPGDAWGDGGHEYAMQCLATHARVCSGVRNSDIPARGYLVAGTYTSVLPHVTHTQGDTAANAGACLGRSVTDNIVTRQHIGNEEWSARTIPESTR